VLPSVEKVVFTPLSLSKNQAFDWFNSVFHNLVSIDFFKHSHYRPRLLSVFCSTIFDQLIQHPQKTFTRNELTEIWTTTEAAYIRKVEKEMRSSRSFSSLFWISIEVSSLFLLLLRFFVSSSVVANAIVNFGFCRFRNVDMMVYGRLLFVAFFSFSTQFCLFFSRLCLLISSRKS
jgi:hypothetical protein